MPTQDRTNEFRACVESIRNRSSVPSRSAEQRQRLLNSRGKDKTRSEFTSIANAIGKDISSTALKLNKLAQRKSMSEGRCPSTVFMTMYDSGETENVIRR